MSLICSGPLRSSRIALSPTFQCRDQLSWKAWHLTPAWMGWEQQIHMPKHKRIWWRRHLAHIPCGQRQWRPSGHHQGLAGLMDSGEHLHLPGHRPRGGQAGPTQFKPCPPQLFSAITVASPVIFRRNARTAVPQMAMVELALQGLAAGR